MSREHITKTNPNGEIAYCEDFSIHLGHEFKSNPGTFFTAWCPGIKAEIAESMGEVGISLDIIKNTVRAACAKELSDVVGISFASWDEALSKAATLVVNTPELMSYEENLQKAREEAVDNYTTSLGHSLMQSDEFATIMRKVARSPKLLKES